MRLENLIPGFAESCIRLHDALLNVTLALLVVSIVVQIVSQPSEPMGLIRHLIRMFLVMLLITHTSDFINALEKWIQTFMESYVPARPDQIAELYKSKLEAADSSIAEMSWWSMLLSSSVFEAIVYGVLYLISQLAAGIQFFVNLFQQLLLWFCWVLSPVMFAFFAIPRFSGIATQHVVRIVGLSSWKLGLAFASTITEGLIRSQLEPHAGLAEGTRYVLVNLLSLALIGGYVIVSSIVAPIYMQRLVGGGTGALIAFQHGATQLGNRFLPAFSRFTTSKVVPTTARTAARVAVPLAGLTARTGIATATGAVRAAHRTGRLVGKVGNFLFTNDDPTGDKAIQNYFHGS